MPLDVTADLPQPPPAPLTGPEQVIIDDIVGAIKPPDGVINCILFLGAGVHGIPWARQNIEDVLARLPAEVFHDAFRSVASTLPAEILEGALAPGAAGQEHDEVYLQVLQAILEKVLEPVYPPVSRPLLGGDLAERLARLGKPTFCDTFPTDSPRNLGRVGLFYEVGSTRSRNDLVREIEAAVQTNKQPSPIVHALAELPFKLIITTNYDGLFERALRRQNREPFVNVYDPKGKLAMQDWSRRVRTETPYLLKLHGDIAAGPTLVVTDEDYIQFVLRMNDKQPLNPVPGGLRAELNDNSILFIGYSLMDYNLRLLFKTIRWSMDVADIKPSYSIDPHPNELVVRVLSSSENNVKFIAQDAWTIVPRIYEGVTGQPFDIGRWTP
jgi:hypothetical protein